MHIQNKGNCATTFIVIAFLAHTVSGWGQEDSRTIFREIFAQEEPHLLITIDFEELLEKEDEELDATFRYAGNDKTWDVKIEARGKYRRKVCPFPPLRLNFKKGDLEDEGFKPFDKIKLVTHCSEEDVSLETIYEEYLAYQIYNCITDASFEAKLVRMTYTDSGVKYDPIESWGILLEPNNELEDRLGGKMYDKFNLPQDSLIPENYLQTALFQFMIGNHDWSIEMYKNIKCLYLPEKGKYMIIPYDFDYTGFVHPDYYQPEAQQGMTHIKDRLYLGKFFDDQLPAVIGSFLDAQDEVRSVCKGFKQLRNPARAEASNYINQFFRLLRNDADKISYGYRIPYN